MQSKTDYTLFWCNLVLFSFLAITFSIPFWRIDILGKVTNGSTKHIVLLVGYIIVFILAPLYALSWSVRSFLVENGTITFIDLFGLRKRTYPLSARTTFKVKQEDAPYRFRWFPLNERYYRFRTLTIDNHEDLRERIQSCYLMNFEAVNMALRKNVK
jgi:hypothetical protein